MSSIVDGYSESVAIVPSCGALVIKLVQCSLASLARATARQQCLLRKESVISGRNVVNMFMDFSYTVPLQRRTRRITQLSPYVPLERFANTFYKHLLSELSSLFKTQKIGVLLGRVLYQSDK
ncbi:Hypothetical_protein [Hexamita inflata]|uniref:Hypothetical_protein n=1 Tax=Hexamita inflata TaxID=28002 RepID=A0AA86PBZ0_9EUKA|nr:Hypothetical protein HINF_LOCUS23601 [Hexamita inflata]